MLASNKAELLQGLKFLPKGIQTAFAHCILDLRVKKMREKLVLLLLAAAVVSFYVGYSATPSPLPSPTPTIQPVLFSNSVRLPLIAVDTEGNGVLADLIVDVSKGTGKFFIGGESNPLVNSDTQSSLKTAFYTAENYTGRYDLNVYYSFSTDSEAVGGRSAGAASTIATIAAMQGKNLNSKVLITGTIEPDGSIGPVGKIFEKAKTIKKDGRFSTFLVPKGESKQSVLVEECTEKKTGNSFYRQCASAPKLLDVANETGLNLVEVGSVRQAFELMAKTG